MATKPIARLAKHPNVLSSPLVIMETELDFIAETLETAIRRVTDDLVREGHHLG